jgi:hypothetical protein
VCQLPSSNAARRGKASAPLRWTFCGQTFPSLNSVYQMAALLPNGTRCGGYPFLVFHALSPGEEREWTPHITKRLGDIVYAANKSDALRQLAQCPLDAAVLARQADTIRA